MGHIEGSSLPVGGESTHCVISGHRGLPSARLFTDLDQLSEGDIFTLRVLDETLTYEVDQIHVVEPDDISLLEIVEGEDPVSYTHLDVYKRQQQGFVEARAGRSSSPFVLLAAE